MPEMVEQVALQASGVGYLLLDQSFSVFLILAGS